MLYTVSILHGIHVIAIDIVKACLHECKFNPFVARFSDKLQNGPENPFYLNIHTMHILPIYLFIY